MEEIFDVLNTEGEVIGSASRKECHTNRELIHPVIHLHIFDQAGRLYLQKRSLTKDLLPGYWDSAVGGHISRGEAVEVALLREAEEELGIDARGAEFLYSYIWSGISETEFVRSYRLTYTGSITPDGEEVMEGRFFTIEEIRSMFGKDTITPNFEFEFLNHLSKFL